MPPRRDTKSEPRNVAYLGFCWRRQQSLAVRCSELEFLSIHLNLTFGEIIPKSCNAIYTFNITKGLTVQ